MAASYADPQFEVAPERRTVTARFRLTGPDRDAIGWQIFDPETATFISEGQWQPVDGGRGHGRRATPASSRALPRLRICSG